MTAWRTGQAFLLGSLFGGACVGSFWWWPEERRNPGPQLKVEEDGRQLEKSSNQPSIEDSGLFRYGRPELPSSYHSYKAHSLAYDRSRRVPVWVAETIDRAQVQSKQANRKKSQFRPDPTVPSGYSSANEDFRNSGWSRGHMAPAGDCKHSQDAMDDTFYLTNIVPQDVDNNSGYWNRLEMFCRALTHQFEKVHVISGPLFLPQVDEKEGKTYVKYQGHHHEKMKNEGCVQHQREVCVDCSTFITMPSDVSDVSKQNENTS